MKWNKTSKESYMINDGHGRSISVSMVEGGWQLSSKDFGLNRRFDRLNDAKQWAELMMF